MFKGKAVYLLLGVILVTAIILRITQLFYNSGSWVCVDGSWKKDGNTSDVKPSEACVKEEVEDEQKFILEGDATTSEIVLPVPSEENVSQNNRLAIIETPKSNSVVSSPLVVRGDAPGTWFFEASFPVKLIDNEGNLIIAKPAMAQSDPLTENFVPYETLLEFNTTATSGYLVLTNDNPSGLPENELSVKIPVLFLNK